MKISTKQVQFNQWFKLYDKQITEEEYRQIRNNLGGFFTLLCEWDKEDKHIKQIIDCLA